jgi:hypothetical protein
MSRFSRRAPLAISGIVLSVSYPGFLGGAEFGHGWAAPVVAGVFQGPLKPDEQIP